jgi:hypothetical protein
MSTHKNPASKTPRQLDAELPDPAELAALIVRLDKHRRAARRRGLTPLAEDLGEALAALRGLLFRPTTFIGGG